LPEIVLSVNIEEAYARLRAQLTQGKCRIVAEKAPNTISVIQGSLWGISPNSAQKRIKYQLHQDALGTRVTSTSNLTSGYINLTLLGVVFSVGLLFVCAWIALDLSFYAEKGASFWSWLVWTGGPFGYFDSNVAAFLVRVMLILVVFLGGTLGVEAVIVIKVRSKKDLFAQETLRALQD
jgi:hypothetical protein